MKKYVRCIAKQLCRAAAAAVVVLLAAATAKAQSDSGAPVAQAAPLDGTIEIDGRLDEAAWQDAVPETGFRQFEPEEGAPASLQTEVRILYGANSLYVGAMLHDEHPEAIIRALGRRDELNRADWFIIAIDSYFDRRTAYAFAVNAAGVQFDGLREVGGGGPGGGPGGGGPNRGYDASWDAVWYSDVGLTPDGWVAELRIPYSMLRFSEEERQTWGVQFTRRIPRLGEQAEWPLVARVDRGNLIANFGLLQGIEGVDPRPNIQISPYTVSRLETFEHPETADELASDTGMDVGGDLKVGLGTNATLDATINPDFGQVESDPAVLNLTAFETQFEERRPFFVEGSQIYAFSVGPGQLLYSRRIGADGPIVGATKLSGRTAGGLSFGVLGATVGDEFNPEQHFGVARATQQIGSYSSAGGILTGMSWPVGDGRRYSLVGGADWDLRFLQNRFGLEGFASVTDRRHPALNAETGFAGKMWARKRSGAWQGFLGVDVFSDEFNPNDVGLLDQNNFIALLNSVEHDVLGGRPFGPFQRASVESFIFQSFSYREGLDLGTSLDFSAQATTVGFQQIQMQSEFQNVFGGYDLYETRGLGPWAAPAKAQIGFEVETDERRQWQVEPEAAVTAEETGGRGLAIGFRGNWNVGTRLALEANFEGEWEEDVTAWTSNETFLRAGDEWMIGRAARPPDELLPDDFVPIAEDDDLDGILQHVTPIDGNRYYVPIFGERDTRSLDLTVRSTVTFTPVLSLQLYSQLFLARGRFDRFQIMQNRDDLASFEGFPKRNNFSFGSLQSNLVLRWEYRRGSALFIVWTHGRRSDDELNPLAPWGESPYDRALQEHLGDTFRVFPDNVFLIKLNYTFLY